MNRMMGEKERGCSIKGAYQYRRKREEVQGEEEECKEEKAEEWKGKEC